MNIYTELITAVEDLGEKAVEKTKKEITRKGYDTTGYQYQYLVNVLNEVVGMENWGMDYVIIKEIEGQTAGGQKTWEITTNVNVWIKVGGGIAKRSLAGGHKSTSHADALKGAITNGFKKTVALFGIGKKAYEGTLDDDYTPIPEDNRVEKKVVDDVNFD